MLQWVYEQAQSAALLERIIIATDDQRILEAGASFGAESVMTSAQHQSGTERAAEVAAKINVPIVINIQGDEPLIQGEMIDSLVKVLQEESTNMATLACKNTNLSQHSDRNIVKVVADKQGFALYFSRSPIPLQPSDFFWHHIGLYGYQRDFLLRFKDLSFSRLENIEKLEQLRALENGFRIRVVETPYSTLSVDTPEDIIRVENKIKERFDG
jgi:3-deoxy-manno-octulosonate cytidylyltransferase (CMP-KDO synthetase)